MLFFTIWDKRYKLFSIGIVLTVLWSITMIVRFCSLLSQRSFFLYYVLLFLGWLFYDILSRKDHKDAQQFLNHFSRKMIPLLLLSILGGFAMLQRDFSEPFSGIQETGHFLKSLPSDFQICTLEKDDKITGVTAWTKAKMRVLSLDIDCTFDPRMRNAWSRKMLDEKTCTELLIPPKKRVIVTAMDKRLLEILAKNSYKVIFVSHGTPCVTGERFFVMVHSSFLEEIKRQMPLPKENFYVEKSEKSK